MRQCPSQISKILAEIQATYMTLQLSCAVFHCVRRTNDTKECLVFQGAGLNWKSRPLKWQGFMLQFREEFQALHLEAEVRRHLPMKNPADQLITSFSVKHQAATQVAHRFRENVVDQTDYLLREPVLKSETAWILKYIMTKYTVFISIHQYSSVFNVFQCVLF